MMAALLPYIVVLVLILVIFVLVLSLCCCYSCPCVFVIFVLVDLDFVLVLALFSLPLHHRLVVGVGVVIVLLLLLLLCVFCWLVETQVEGEKSGAKKILRPPNLSPFLAGTESLFLFAFVYGSETNTVQPICIYSVLKNILRLLIS